MLCLIKNIVRHIIPLTGFNHFTQLFLWVFPG